ncbi:MAG TPA: nuclear transport factor 2 family protein, partial [Armatimonadota bacterium]|nr:nuclear transport factor 2 family protein [Armatimonadota bacterium]
QKAREALTEAINARDMESIRSLVHPSYRGTSDLGVTLDYNAMMEAAQQVVNSRGFHETVEIESARGEGDTATLVTRRTDSFTGLLWIKQRSTTRQEETWRNVDGRWMLVAEKQL